MSILGILLIVWIVASAAEQLLTKLWPASLTPLLRFVYSAGIGLCMLSYGMLLLGWMGVLTRTATIVWLIILAITGFPSSVKRIRYLRSRLKQKSFHLDHPKLSLVIITCSVLLGAVTLFASFRPPGAIEWDALSYHLADPAVYVRMHRIQILPTEHHSNFPFTMEMLYSIGLLFHSYALANLFHYTTAVLTVLCLIGIGYRWNRPLAGYASALVFLATPLVLWEASTAYIDVAGGLYGLLAAYAAYNAVDNELASEKLLWSALCGISLGIAMGIKYLALIPIVIMLAYLVIRKSGWKSVLITAVTCFIVCCPWYIKNIVLMHNPVYPFYYQLFPHSKYWSLHRAVIYSAEQNRFGLAHSLKQPRTALMDLLATPWQIVANEYGYFNAGEYNFAALIGGCYTALLGLALLQRQRYKLKWDMFLLAVSQFIIWFFLAQVGRYLLQMIPLAALVSGLAIQDAVNESDVTRKLIDKAVSFLAVSLPIASCVYYLFMVSFVPENSQSGQEISRLTGLLPSVISLQEIAKVANSKTEQQRNLRNTLDVYAAEEWLNHHTRKTSGVIIYDDTRGLYLNRPYLWGNGEHSSYIPYTRVSNAQQLSDWFLKHGYRYAMINLFWSPRNTKHIIPNDSDAPEKLMEWYTTYQVNEPEWRYLLGQSISSGLWKIVVVKHGVVILRI